MTIHAERGTKRTCQNEECGVRFYDLMRKTITCPICRSPFVPPPVREIVFVGTPKISRSAFPRSSAPPLPGAKTAAKELEVELAASDDAGDAETKIEPESTDAILEPEDDDVDPSADVLPLPEGEKE